MQYWINADKAGLLLYNGEHWQMSLLFPEVMQ